MEPIDIILIVLLAVAMIGIIAYLIRKKLKGESGCGCGCSGCPNASACQRATLTKEKTPESNADGERKDDV